MGAGRRRSAAAGGREPARERPPGHGWPDGTAAAHGPTGMCKVDPALQTADAFIEIGDSGPGLADEMSDRLFTPFSTTKATGTGLGLVVARSMIQDHGGTLTGTNRGGDERGAIFTVHLPAVL